MTGAEHYAEAERLLASVAADLPKSDAEIPGMAVLMQMAQAHATLAQVVYLREIGDQLDTRLRVSFDPKQLAKLVAVGTKKAAAKR